MTSTTVVSNPEPPWRNFVVAGNFSHIKISKSTRPPYGPEVTTGLGVMAARCENSTMADPTTDKDRLFEDELATPGDFVFDQRVVRVFPDMINRSVPGYGLIVPMMGMLARRYAVKGSTLYDLGCSLGAVSLAMQAAVMAPDVSIVAVDNSPEMIRRFSEDLERRDGGGLANHQAPLAGYS